MVLLCVTLASCLTTALANHLIVRILEEVIELPLTNPELLLSVWASRHPEDCAPLQSPRHRQDSSRESPGLNLSATFLKVVASAIVDKYIGESARIIREMFGFARDHQPCVIFMDEIDAMEAAVLIERDSTYTYGVAESNGWIEEQGQVKNGHGRNRPDILDPALLRPGRLDRKIEIQNPMKRSALRSSKFTAQRLQRGDIDFESVVKLADGLNGADMRNVCTEAGMIGIMFWRKIFMKAARKILDNKKLGGKLDYSKV
ncbi:LOW QUALITY PROTEIN: hypothetical protein ACHAWO_008380 [Cyclotella atomus]|uniref:Uncharacterized protein n=1 Tax=Cyclotella atomus TaxID=382360 RepID=A0ABD3P6S6_9STRA